MSVNSINDSQRGVRASLDKTIGSDPTQRASYGYDTVDQLTSEVLSIGGTPQWSKSFAYDLNSGISRNHWLPCKAD